MRERRAAGLGGTCHPRSLSGPCASEPGGRTPSLPECAPGPRSARDDARGKLGCGVQVALRPLGRAGQGAAPPAPRSPRGERKRRMRGLGVPLLPGAVAAPRNPLPRPDPRGRTAAREGGEGERPGRGIFDVSLWGGCRFPYGGGRRACVRAELGVPGAASAPLGGCRAATRETLDARRGRVPGRPVAPAPARASWGHSPPASGHLCAPRPPSPSCPLGSPRAGGGNRRPRLDSASQAAAGSGGGKRGAAGSRGRSRVGACGPAERARVAG